MIYFKFTLFIYILKYINLIHKRFNDLNSYDFMSLIKKKDILYEKSMYIFNNNNKKYMAKVVDKMLTRKLYI